MINVDMYTGKTDKITNIDYQLHVSLKCLQSQNIQLYDINNS